MINNIFALSKGFDIFGFTIYFYAFCILGGALVALFLSNFRAKEEGFPSDLFNTIFLLALPMGIIGARAWYVIASWEDFTNNLSEIFAFRDGGLAIQGGALLGALSGILFAFFRRKGMNLLQCADFAVPTILVAQAIGRWGNFINQEVYGNAVNSSLYWLPSFIQNQMVINGSYRVPLFFIEGIINLGGYIVIGRVIPQMLKKHYLYGDQTFAYFTFYGIVRLILEPLRDSKFNMGAEAGSLRASSMAIVFIVSGLLLIVLNHLYHFYKNRKKEQSK